MKRPDTIWSRFVNQFRRKRLPAVHEGDSSEQEEAYLEEVWQKETAKLDEAWDRIRALMTRGNAAGAVASLTLFGSQQIGSRSPRLNVFWTLVIFASGLLALLIREFLIVWRVHYQREGKISQAIDGGETFDPPRFIMKLARWFDWLSAGLLISGVLFGFYILYGLAL